MSHRRPAMPSSMLRHQPKGQCRWCDTPILKPDGSINTARGWHPECVKIYRIACFSNDQREAVFQRDIGICARRGTDTINDLPKSTRMKAFLELGKSPPYWAMGPMGNLWQADHIRPLLDANRDLEFFLLSNLQTLCTKCRVEKGVEDNRRRKESRSVTVQPILEFA